MDIEVREVRDFLAAHAPWAGLPPDALNTLVGESTLRYFRRSSTLYAAGEANNSVHIVRSGGVDLRDAEGQLVERLGPGGAFGATSVLERAPSRLGVTTIEDTLLVVVPGEAFLRLCAAHEDVRLFFEATADHRLRGAVSESRRARNGAVTLARTVESFLDRSPVMAPSGTSIRQAAVLMSEHRVSALLLVEGGRLVGIVTDRDLRSKVVAHGLDVDAPVASVMTADPLTIPPDARVFEVLLLMSSRGIHHLPVVREGQVVGVVSSGDVMRLERAHPIYLAADIARQTDVEGVARVCARVPQLVAEYVETDASAPQISRLLGSISDAATRRLVALAVDELGPAPGRWAWVALGSQARHEAGLGADQDHAIVLADDVADADRGWWAELADRVVAGLEAAGYPRCRGEVMATRWCDTVTGWRRQFAGWMATPDSREVLHAQIFFDMRALDGDAGLVDQVRAAVTASAPASERFLGHLATQAVADSPPLGFFKGFVLQRGGEHADTLDLKTASHSIIQLARVHSLALGSDEVGTPERLRVAAARGRLDADLAASLVDAAEFINHLRLVHQAAEVRQGRRPDNFVAPARLTSLDQRTLKEAFAVIARAQRSLGYSFKTHLMG